MMRFYVWQPGIDPEPLADLSPELRAEIWRPSATSIRPRGLPLLPYVVWWLFHYLRIFSNRRYGAVVVRSGNVIVHNLLVTPRYFRFTDMGADDVQIGATHTHADWRGRGLARAAVGIVCRVWNDRQARLWYIVSDENAPSIRVIESCGFRLLGVGERSKRLGLSLLGQFRVISNKER